jgi:hypothetical protein
MTRSAPAKGTKMEKELKPIPAGKKGKGLRQMPKTARNKMGFMKTGGLTKAQEKKLKKHSKHHSAKHMSAMKKDFNAGKSFNESHNKAMKKVSK